MSGPLHLVATITALRSDTAPGLLAALRALASETLCEPGCERYELCVSDTEPGRFVLIERWSTHAAWRRHMKTPHIDRFRVETKALVGAFDLITLAPAEFGS